MAFINYAKSDGFKGVGGIIVYTKDGNELARDTLAVYFCKRYHASLTKCNKALRETGIFRYKGFTVIDINVQQGRLFYLMKQFEKLVYTLPDARGFLENCIRQGNDIKTGRLLEWKRTSKTKE